MSEWIAENIIMKILLWIILFRRILVEILRDKSMHVKTCVQNIIIQVIDHNYMNNGRNFNPSKRIDSREDKNEDCTVYFLWTHNC